MNDNFYIRVIETGEQDGVVYAWTSVTYGADERICCYTLSDDGRWLWRDGLPEPDMPDAVRECWQHQRASLLDAARQEVGMVFKLR